MESKTFYSHGKLLICGEYAVLKGATAFVLPVKAGQSMHVTETVSSTAGIEWISYDASGSIWFQARISLPDIIVTECTDQAVALRLVRFLLNARGLNSEFLLPHKWYRVETHLEFEADEGLGSSSTLTANIAQWAKVDPFQLHFSSFKGSGFDVAMAIKGKPLLYTLRGQIPEIETLEWKKDFSDKLYFVHLNKKQISRNAIQQEIRFSQPQLNQISRISKLLCSNDDYFEFCLLLELAESETALALGRTSIKQELFPDYHGTVKSLGAWGGDYVLVTGTDTETYFRSKGYNRIIPFKDMILQ